MTTNSCSGGYDTLNFGFGDVYKFGADSFYNWETDNLPIEDLESRTNYLLQAAGGTSSITGATLVLSSTADPDSSVYDSIQNIVDRIPKRLTFPLLVEICSYGELGALDLHGIQCEGDGQLEIINRNFGQAWPDNYRNNVLVGDASMRIASTGILSASSQIQGFVAPKLFSDIQDASSTRIATNCFTSGTGGWNDKGKVLASLTTDSSALPIDTTFSVVSGAGFISTALGVFPGTFNLAEYASQIDPTTLGNDVSAHSTPSGTTFQLLSDLQTKFTYGLPLGVHAYGNSFSKVSVKNCGGTPIKLTGILADGATGSGVNTFEHTSYAGFEFENSRVDLESCGSVRNKLFGFKALNSDLFVREGMIAYRNYPTSGIVRGDSSVYHTEDHIDSFVSGVGLYLSNSRIVFDTSSDIANSPHSSPGHKHYEFARSGYGILMENSTLAGGVGGHTNTAANQGGFKGTTSPLGTGINARDHQTTFIQAHNNSKAGIKLVDSNFEYNGIPKVYLNAGPGLVAENSNLKCIGLHARVNQEEGVLLKNSNWEYAYGAEKYRAGYRHADNIHHQVSFQAAGQGYSKPALSFVYNGESQIRATKGSSIYPTKLSNAYEVLGNFGGEGLVSGITNGMMGLEGNDTVSTMTQPYVWIDKGSNAELVSFSAAMRHSAADLSVMGHALRVSDNSTAKLIGTKYFSTMIYKQANPGTYSTTDYLLNTVQAAAAADRNSHITFCGPTKISGAGVAALANSNSKLSFVPNKAESSNLYDNVSYNLSGESGNHTKVDLHSLRACLVANNNSEIEMYGLGGTSIHAASANLDSWALSTDPPTGRPLVGNLPLHTSGGYMQFFPNGYTADILTISASSVHPEKAGVNPAATSGSYFPMQVTGTMGNQNDIATGGMCVRAVGSSKVDVNYVNFPMGVSTSAVSGVYYNIQGSANEHVDGYGASGGAGSHLYLWNIADNSRIHAANVLVSSLNSSGMTIYETGRDESTYHGPAGRWNNETALDYYGANGVAGSAILDTATYHNHGPFRLVFGTRGLVKSFHELNTHNDNAGNGIAHASSMGGSPVDQITGQGYMITASSVDAVSANDYGHYLKYENTGGQGRAVVFGGVYGSIQTPSTGVESGYREGPVSVIHGDSTAYMRNFLDRSASDLFANAKHCANPRVGFVSIYNSSTDPVVGGEGRDSTNEVSFGKGVRSLNIFDLDRLL